MDTHKPGHRDKVSSRTRTATLKPRRGQNCKFCKKNEEAAAVVHYHN